MGSALAIGLGLAYQRPDLKVIVISGDGAILMSAGTYALMGYLIEEKKLSNLTCIVLRNNSYASTGGQLNCYHYFDTGSIGAFKEIEVGETSDAPRIPLTCKEIKERFVESIRIRD
jgi:thiamine pyrophosphate-dependent acetolactate synthase large subunit-like protein